jgi:hypothetical protein
MCDSLSDNFPEAQAGGVDGREYDFSGQTGAAVTGMSAGIAK